MKEPKVTKQELNQEGVIEFILDNTNEASTFRTYKTTNYVLVCVDIFPMEKEML